MVNFRSTTVAITLTAAAAVVNATTTPGASLWEINNRTSHGIQPLAEATQIITFCGVDLIGSDIGTARAGNPDTCIGLCRPETGCDAATWTKFEGGTCFFKRVQNSWANSQPNVGAASFIRAPVRAGAVTGRQFPARDTDMPGNDIETRQVDSFLECQVVCSMHPFCFAYTFTNYNGGSCYLKSKASAFVSYPGAFSEYSGRVTNPDTCLTFA